MSRVLRLLLKGVGVGRVAVVSLHACITHGAGYVLKVMTVASGVLVVMLDLEREQYRSVSGFRDVGVTVTVTALCAFVHCTCLSTYIV